MWESVWGQPMESSNRESGIETIKIEEIQAKLNKGEWVTVHSKAPEDTAALGALLGRTASPGQIYTLTGDLGVGKTVFTQGFAKGLGVAGPVNSPTFTIVQIYGEGICLIEWAELIEEILPRDIVQVIIEKDLEKGFDYRRISVKSHFKRPGEIK